jgi:hypothetical protein
MSQYRDSIGTTVPTKLQSQQNPNPDNMGTSGTFRADLNNPTPQPSSANANFNAPGGNFQYGNPRFPAPNNGNQYFREDAYKSQAFPPNYNTMNMSQPSFPQENTQNPYNKFPSMNQGYNAAPQNEMLSDFNNQARTKLPNPQMQPTNETFRKPAERSNFSKNEMPFDYKPQPSSQSFASSTQMNNYPPQYMSGYSNEFEDLKKNPSNTVNIKSASAFPNANPSSDNNIARENMGMAQGNRRNMEIHDEFDKFIQDGSLNVGGGGNSNINDQEHFPRTFEESLFDRPQDFF